LKQNESTSLELEILNPKNESDITLGRDAKVFPYYAGYARSFAEHVLKEAHLAPNSIVLDPWNGSGTTLLAAARHGLKALGFDLNPVMVIASKATLCFQDEKQIFALANSVLADSGSYDQVTSRDDPLCKWLAPSSVAHIRKIESAINQLCFGQNEYVSLLENVSLDRIDPMSAFLYICLFRTVRTLLSDFIPSNPTWVKSPKELFNRKRPSKTIIESIFFDQAKTLSRSLPKTEICPSNFSDVSAHLGDARSLLLQDESVEFILTSPPYCTRIDYAVATSIELAVLRCSESEFENIRRSLVGNSMIAKNVPALQKSWGKTCSQFLHELYTHSSQASRSYYYKTHLQYFESLYNFIVESARLLKLNSKAVFVVQDSYYKEIRNDVAQMTVEMCNSNGFDLVQRRDFSKTNSMSVINTRARRYLPKRQTVETVLVFKKVSKKSAI